jgi:hypothetical protein
MMTRLCATHDEKYKTVSDQMSKVMKIQESVSAKKTLYPFCFCAKKENWYLVEVSKRNEYGPILSYFQ